MAIHYQKVPSSQGAHQLINTIQSLLDSGKRTLWLVSGGTNVSIESFVAANLNVKSGLLTAALIDERYGVPGHKDSNHQKLIDGDFPHEQLKLAPVLLADKTIEEMASVYETHIRELFKNSDVIIAQLGIGADGHTAGVLPHSAAVESKKFVEFYRGPDFTRLTLTLEALKNIGSAFVFAYGDNKHVALSALHARTLPLDEQPSQILKQIPSVYLYNDHINGGD
jgi:6-phosphogluconolactonase/glucosamine-6-phosphate isomerase/deaminase